MAQIQSGIVGNVIEDAEIEDESTEQWVTT